MNRCLTLLLLGALLVAGCTSPYNVEADQADTKTWPAAAVAAIDVQTENGLVWVRASTDTDVSARITKSCRGTTQADAEVHLVDITTGDSTSGTTLFLWGKVPEINNRHYRTDFELTAPAASPLRIETENGAVDLDSMAGPTVIVTDNGAVTATAHVGSISIEATNGAIDCDVAALDPGETAALRADNGQVTLYLPADASVAFDITTNFGEAKVEGFANVHYTTNAARHKAGTIGTGAATATLSSENGVVTVQAK